MWLDLVLKGIGLASTIIATLQAGSRVAFLVDHNYIGILEGPTITRPPLNETDKASGNSLFEISEAFRHCVRLAYAPQFYDDVKFEQPVRKVVDSYPLSTRPHEDSKLENEAEEDQDEEEETIQEEEDAPTTGPEETFQEEEDAPTAGPEETFQEEEDAPADIPTGDNSTLNVMISDESATLLEYNETFNDDSVTMATTGQPSSFSNRLAFAINPLNGARILASWITAVPAGDRKTLNTELSDINATLLESSETFSDASEKTSTTVQRPFFSKRLAFAINPMNGARILANWIPPAIRQSQEYLAVTPKLAKFYAKKALDKRVGQDEIENMMSEWDHGFSTEAKLEYRTPLGKEKVAELSVFCPDAFANLRSTFGISEESYRNSIFGSGPFVSFQSNSKGAARVGGVFFFTRDGAYMIKTIKKEEAKTFLEMLPKYHHHMKRFSRTSLLTRFCGMYGVRIHEKDSLDKGQLHTFVVMNAVFPAEASSFVTERFDLKGSTVGREVSQEELERKGRDAVLKDLDLAREVQLVRSLQTESNSGEYGFTIGASAKAALLSQLREDVRLLVDCGVMDYSLLVGVVDMAGKHKQAQYTREALVEMQKAGVQLERLEAPAKKKKLDKQALSALVTPIQLLLAPPISVARQAWSIALNTLSSVITLPLPYYGSGNCVVDGGQYSIIYGKRRGDRAIYYMGLIDFLQPWTTRKRVERRLKGLMGHDITAISCVDPEEYAKRFLEFLDANIS